MALYWTNDSTALSSANIHQACIHSDFLTEMGVLAYRVLYNGASWAVSGNGSVDTAGSVTAVWNATDDKVTIDWSAISNFLFTSNFPACFVQPVLGTADYTTARYWPQCKAISATEAEVTFWDQASPGTQETTETTSMDFYIFLIGKIS